MLRETDAAAPWHDFTLAGLVCVGLSMVGALVLVTDLLFGAPFVIVTTVAAALACVVLWCLLPLRRRPALR